jgi:hypothetical protein
MKTFIVYALLLFTANPTPKPDGKGKQGDSQANSETESPIIVVNNSSTHTEAPHGKKEAPKGDASVWANGADWALVAVGVATLLAVWKQAKETAKATEAMRDGIALQEAAFQQWVEITNWTASKSGDHVFDVGFDLVNSSNWPLTVVTTHITIGTTGSLRDHNIMLTPKQPYTVGGLSMPFVDEWYRKSYLGAGGAMQPVRGAVTYTNCLHRTVRQEFSGLIICSPTGVRFQPSNLTNIRFKGDGGATEGDNAKNPN